MKNSPQARRLINNELKTRAFNQKAKRSLKEHTPIEEQGDLHIDFYCECSRENCSARIALTLAEYDAHHQQANLFVVAKSHESPLVEEIDKETADLQVVRKFELAP